VLEPGKFLSNGFSNCLETVFARRTLITLIVTVVCIVDISMLISATNVCGVVNEKFVMRQPMLVHHSSDYAFATFRARPLTTRNKV
jgi:hypothetical protein